MNIAFFGHADLFYTAEDERRILAFLEKTLEDRPTGMYLGGYGNFDCFAYRCCMRYKAVHKDVSLLFVSPYVAEAYRTERLAEIRRSYDGIVYPGIEDKPLRYAIYHRNRWMVTQADIVLCAVSRCYGGAYQAVRYAKHLKKPIFNLLAAR